MSRCQNSQRLVKPKRTTATATAPAASPASLAVITAAPLPPLLPLLAVPPDRAAPPAVPPLLVPGIPPAVTPTLPPPPLRAAADPAMGAPMATVSDTSLLRPTAA
ncbi:proline-rich protein 36-like [Cydia strobilella]|uniref:proline-rich protein 36-like n=1 Tax=Cydia strobilella TaxID=1100964 RepID=UPI0030059E7E